MSWVKRLLQRGGSEHRESSTYTDTLVAAAYQRATGSTLVAPAATAALESAAGFVGRAFASAAVSAPAFADTALSPALLLLVGRSLIRSGELVCQIDVDSRGLRLTPASSWDINGGADPDTWTYRLNLPGPSTTLTRPRVPAAAVLHFRYSVEPTRPWCGIGPIQAANLAGKLSAETAAALADEASGPRGNVMPLPVDGEDPTVATLKADLKALRGSLALVESVNSMNVGAEGTAPAGDWVVRRIGANPPVGLVDLQRTATREVLAACGLNPALFQSDGETTAREAYRQALHATIAPLGRLVAEELGAKLDAPVVLDWTELRAGDVAGRARAFRTLIEGGMVLEEAARVSGVLSDAA